jgi:hypothetical protein
MLIVCTKLEGCMCPPFGSSQHLRTSTQDAELP